MQMMMHYSSTSKRSFHSPINVQNVTKSPTTRLINMHIVLDVDKGVASSTDEINSIVEVNKNPAKSRVSSVSNNFFILSQILFYGYKKLYTSS